MVLCYAAQVISDGWSKIDLQLYLIDYKYAVEWGLDVSSILNERRHYLCTYILGLVPHITNALSLDANAIWNATGVLLFLSWFLSSFDFSFDSVFVTYSFK